MITKNITEYLLLMGGFFLFFFLLVYVLHRLKQVKLNKNKFMQIVGGVSLGAKEKIVTVKVKDKMLVLGVTASQINTLLTYDEEEKTSQGVTDKDLSFIEQFQKVSTYNRKVSSE